MGPGAIARIVLVAVVLPLVAGIAVRALLPRIAERLNKPVRLVGERTAARCSAGAGGGIVAGDLGCDRRRHRVSRSSPSWWPHCWWGICWADRSQNINGARTFERVPASGDRARHRLSELSARAFRRHDPALSAAQPHHRPALHDLAATKDGRNGNLRPRCVRSAQGRLVGLRRSQNPHFCPQPAAAQDNALRSCADMRSGTHWLQRTDGGWWPQDVSFSTI